MPTPGIIVAAMAVALVVIGAQKTVHGVKKVGHQIGCLAKTGHKCPPKPQPATTKQQPRRRISNVRWRAAALRSPPSKRCCAAVTRTYRACVWHSRTGPPSYAFWRGNVNDHLFQILIPVTGLVSGLIATYVSLQNRALLAEVRRELAELENRIIARINGTYVRAGECQLREQLVHERLAAIAEDLKNRNAAGD